MKFFQKHMGVMSRHFWERDHEIQIKRFQDRRLARRHAATSRHLLTLTNKKKKRIFAAMPRHLVTFTKFFCFYHEEKRTSQIFLIKQNGVQRKALRISVYHLVY